VGEAPAAEPSVSTPAPPGLLADTAADGGLDARRAAPSRARWGRSLRRATRNTLVVLGLLGAVLVVGMALFADRLAPYPPDEQNFDLIESRPARRPCSAPIASAATC